MTFPYEPPPQPRYLAPALITRRQAEVIDGLCRGLTNAQIASTLGIEAGTVKTHLRRLMKALRANDRAHVVAIALTGGVRVVDREQVKAA